MNHHPVDRFLIQDIAPMTIILISMNPIKTKRIGIVRCNQIEYK